MIKTMKKNTILSTFSTTSFSTSPRKPWRVFENFKIFEHPSNSDIHVNASNVFGVGMSREGWDWVIWNTRISDIMTPLVMTGYLECYSKS